MICIDLRLCHHLIWIGVVKLTMMSGLSDTAMKLVTAATSMMESDVPATFKQFISRSPRFWPRL